MSPTKNRELLPEWLDESFFKDIFAKREELKGRDDFQLKVIEGGSVVGAGENFCAEMYRVKVQCDWDGKSEVISFIVKAGKSSVEFLKEQNVFGTEFEMYRTVVKTFEDMWEKIGEPVSFGPKFLKIVASTDMDILVLSDLKDQGFGMLDRHEGMNEDATLLVLERIAKFHASSVAYKEQVGQFSPLITRKIVDPKTSPMIMKYSLPKVASLAKAAREWKLDEKISKAIEKWADVMYQETIEVTDPDTSPNDFQVLCHGDLWLNNMMFTKDDATGSVTDVVLIDFQLSYWNRPEGDLFYFLLSSVKSELLIQRFDFFLQFYHEKLIGALHKLKVKQSGPSLKALQLQLLKNSFLIPRTTCLVLPVILMDRGDALGIEDLLHDDGDEEKAAIMERKMFYNPQMSNKMKLLLPFFYNRGMLDTNSKSDFNGNKI